MSNVPLPFDRLSGPEFEEFICDFLGAAGHGLFQSRVRQVQRRGRCGQAQNGVDILLRLENGQTIAVECKHRPAWTAFETTTAIAKAVFPADHYILALTRTNDVAIQDVILTQPGGKWKVWFAEDLARLFKEHLTNSDGVRLLSTHFGRGLCWDFLKLSAACHFIAASAFYQGLMDESHLFHHAWPVLGRSGERRRLDAFVRDSALQVLVLPAAGGRGKSKLLHRFSQRFALRHPDWSLRFMDASGTIPQDLDEHLARLPAEGTILVLDDAHRVEHDLRRLFQAVRRNGSRLKLICTTRPQAQGIIDAALAEAEVDPSLVCRVDELSKPDEQALLAWVQRQLKGMGYTSELAWPLIQMSEGSWMFLTIGLQIVAQDKRFPSLEVEAMQNFVMRKFGELTLGRVCPEQPAERVRNLIYLLAAWSPMPESSPFRALAADFLKCRKSDVEAICSALMDAGVLRSSRDGQRLTPDLLADHLLYEKCCQSPSYAEELVQHFAGENLASLLRNLTEVEWRATQHKGKAANLLQPIFQAHRNQFESGRFYQRDRIIELWCGVAVYAPVRFLEMARLAVDCDIEDASTTPGEEEAEYLRHFDPFTRFNILKRLPHALTEVANYHKIHRLEAMDLLWELVQHWPSQDYAYAPHPIEALSKVELYKDTAKRWREPDDVVLLAGWFFDRLASPPVSLVAEGGAQLIMEKLLGPFFEIIQSTVTQVARHSHALGDASVPVAPTKPARDQIRALAAAWISSNDPGVALAGAELLIKAAGDIHNFRGSQDVTEARRIYLPERLSALELMHASWQAANPLARWKLWTHLNRRVSRMEGRDPISMNRAAKQVLTLAENDAPLEMHRLFLSEYEDEFPVHWGSGDPSAAIQSSDDRWLGLGATFAKRIVESYVSPQSLYAAVSASLHTWTSQKMPVRAGRFMKGVQECRPEWLSPLLDLMLSDPAHGGDSLCGPLLHQFRHSQPDGHASAMGRVLDSISPTRPALTEAAVRDIEWFHRKDPLSAQEHNWITTCLARGGPLAANMLLDMIGLLPPNVIESDGIQLAAAALAGQDDEANFKKAIHALHQWKYRYKEGENRLSPPEYPSVMPVLRELARWPRSDRGNEFFKFYSQQHPADVWEFFTARLERAGSQGFSAIPHDHEFSLDFSSGFPEYEIRLEVLLASWESREEANYMAEDAWERWIRLAASSGGERFLRWLEASVDRLESRTLAAICGASTHGSDFIFTHPSLVKRLLLRASSFGQKFKKEAENTLMKGVDRSGVWMETRQHRAHSKAMLQRAVECGNVYRMDATLYEFYKKLEQSIGFRQFRQDCDED